MTIWKDICPRWSTELLHLSPYRTYASLAVKRVGNADRCIPKLYLLPGYPCYLSTNFTMSRFWSR